MVGDVRSIRSKKFLARKDQCGHRATKSGRELRIAREPERRIEESMSGELRGA